MTIAAIIAEYNPFHNGHEYHIRKTREMTGADFIAVILSGSFVQRSEPAMFSKASRVKAALMGGADMVFELPARCVLQSAENYALSGVKLAKAIGADYLSFGSECGDVNLLMQASECMLSDEFNSRVKAEIKNGINYPLAVKAALRAIMPEVDGILDGANNVLGMEYIKAIKKLDCNMKPITFPRFGAMHDDPEAQSGFASASYIRNMISEKQDISGLVPDYFYDIIKDDIENGCVLDRYFYERTLLLDLRRKSPADLSDIRDVGEGMEYRLISELQNGNDIYDVIMRAKSKRYTFSRLKRIVLSSFLNLSGIDSPEYLRIIGLKKEASAAWKDIKSGSELPVVEKITKTEDKEILHILEKDEIFDEIWGSLTVGVCNYGVNRREYPIVL